MPLNFQELSKVCVIKNGFAFKSSQFKSEGIPLLRISNFDDGDVFLNNNQIYVDNDFLKTKGDFIVNKGDVLIALSGATTGKYGIYNFDFPSLLNQRIGLIKSGESEVLNSRYFYYYLNILKTEILRNAAGAAQPNISTRKIADFKIPLPPLKTQQHIAAILDDAAALRDKTAQLLKEYDLLAQSIFLEMFGDPVINTKKFNEVIFTDIMILKRGYDLPVQDRAEGSVPILASNGVLDWHNEYKVIGPGIITGRSGTLGKVHYIDSNYWPLNTALYSQDLKGNNPIYLLYLLRNFRVERFTRGAGVPTLNRNLVHAEKIIYVPIALQNQFAEKIAIIEQQKELAKQELKESEDLFNCLLQKAFKGELVS